MTSRRAVVSWCLYDFANSFYAAVIIATVWAAYYANVIVGNELGQGDLWWGRAVSLTMLFVAVTSPIVGSLADFTGLRKKLLLCYTPSPGQLRADLRFHEGLHGLLRRIHCSGISFLPHVAELVAAPAAS